MNGLAARSIGLATHLARLIGMANPTPSLPPLLEEIAVLIPITSPLRFTRGPPLLPGLMAASVWMKFSSLGDADPAALGTDDPGRHRSFQAEGMPYGQDPVADLDGVAVAEPGRRELVGPLNSHHGQVGLRIGDDLGGLVLPTVLQSHGDLAAAADDVVVGKDDARRIDHQSRSHSAVPVLGRLVG